MRNMHPVAKYELQRVLAFWQGDHRFGLSRSEMQVVIIGWNRLLQLVRRERRVNDQMMMASATPMPERPNCTRNGLSTSAPPLRLMK
jgi:hypothetical protein